MAKSAGGSSKPPTRPSKQSSGPVSRNTRGGNAGAYAPTTGVRPGGAEAPAPKEKQKAQEPT